MQEVSTQYEQLFTNLAARMYNDIAELMDASEAMAVCLDHVDRAILAFGNHFPDTTVIACKKGCHYCCFFPIQSPPQEVVAIARHLISTFSSNEQALLREQLTADIARRTGPLQRGQCPFLDEAKACSIYQERPLACRWFTSPDANICKQSVKDGRNIPQHPIHNRIYEAAVASLLAAAKKQGRFHEQVPFIASLLKALEAAPDTVIW